MKRFSKFLPVVIFALLLSLQISVYAQETKVAPQLEVKKTAEKVAPQLEIKVMTEKELVAEAEKYSPQITPEQAKADMDAGSVIILDVREPKEFKQGHLPGAIIVPRGVLEFKILKKIADQNANIIIYCKVGGRGALAAKTMKIMGYKNLKNIKGGWKAWVKAGLPVE